MMKHKRSPAGRSPAGRPRPRRVDNVSNEPKHQPAKPRSIPRAQLLAAAQVGYRFYCSDQLDRASAVFRGLADLDPENLYNLRALGAVSLAQGCPEETVDAMEKAIALTARGEVWPFLLRAQARFMMNRNRAALTDLRQAVCIGKGPRRIDPNDLKLASALLETFSEEAQ